LDREDFDLAFSYSGGAMKKHFLSIISLLIFLLTVSGCIAERAAPPTITMNVSTLTPTVTLPPQPLIPSVKIPIIYDDDGSPDGTTALLYLLSHRQVDLKAINISYGEAHPEIYIQHIGRMLAAFGIEDIPLGYGQDSPLAGTNEFPEWLRQGANNFWGLPIHNADQTYTVHTAPELMVSIINQSPSPITIFVSGPFTNLAQALQLDPDIINNIAAVYIMGGAVYVPGNIYDFYPDSENKVAEWNIFADPQAASEVFESGIDIYLVPLDATNQVLITKQDTSKWRQGGEIADFAADIYDMLLNNWTVESGAIWDLMTAVIMLKPDVCMFHPLHVQVITEAGNHSGQTAVMPGEEANISVCLEPDPDMIRQTLIDTFSKSISIPTPTNTPELSLTTTPVSHIFRDDFTGDLQEGWEWQNEDTSRWIITPDGWLQIVGGDASLLADEAQSNLLCRHAPEGDYQVIVHLSANPIANFQQATLYIYQDFDHYLAINRGYCGFCLDGGNGMYMEYKYGSVESYKAATQKTNIFLRLVRTGQSVTGYYAFEPNDWQLFATVGNFLENANICLGVSNVDREKTVDADLVGQFDYIEISKP
jgi:inosine-uridine nucleoside N-ribohydrolase